MEKTNNWILRIVVNFNAFDEKTVNIKSKNIEHQAQQFNKKKKRNVFIKDGTVMTVMWYHKRYMLNGNVKIIHWYLPRKVEKSVVYYLWLVLPMVES